MENEVLEKGQKPKLFAMFWSPGVQFERIRQNPRIWVPLLIVTILFAAASAVSAFSMTAEDMMLSGISKEQAELFLTTGRITAIVTGFVTPILTILISTVIFLIIIMIAKKEVTFKQLFSMNTFIMIIGAIGLLLNSLIVAAIGGKAGTYVTSLAGLLNSDSPVLAAFELFGIWNLILIAMGLHRVGQLSKTASIIIAVVLFLISLGLAMLGTFISGMARL